MTKRKPPAVVSASRRKISLLRWHPELKEAQPVTPTPPTAKPPPPLPFPAPPEPPANLPTNRTASLADYDKLLGQPLTWTDAKTREQVQKEILDNEAKQDENAVRRRRMFTAEQVEARERDYDDLVFQHLAHFADVCAELVDVDKKDDARKRGRAFVTEIRKAVAAVIGKKGDR